MKTPTHIAISYLVFHWGSGQRRDHLHLALAGAALPDAFLWAAGLRAGFLALGAPDSRAAFVAQMDRLYFGSPVFVGLHHLSHAPLALLTFLLAVQFLTGREARTRARWFLTGCLAHSAADIFSHSRDGILILWPIDWHFRFDSGIDQWSQGLWFPILELCFCLATAGFALWVQLRKIRCTFACLAVKFGAYRSEGEATNCLSTASKRRET